MDTIRTCYIDSHNAKERNGSYVYDLVGGISVPEGARVFVDNVSFTNTFSEEVAEENQFVYLQTFESDQCNLLPRTLRRIHHAEQMRHSQDAPLHCTAL